VVVMLFVPAGQAAKIASRKASIRASHGAVLAVVQVPSWLTPRFTATTSGWKPLVFHQFTQ